MSIFDELPTTEQALKNWARYCENQLKEMEKNKKRLYKLLEEAERRLKVIEDGRK